MEFTDYLDSNYDIEFVSGGSQIKVSGQCPFCFEDRHDLRLYIGIDTGRGICFHCNTGFNSIKFVMAAESCGWKKAVKILSDDDDEYERFKDEAEPEPEAIFPPMVALGENPAAVEYLLDRGVYGVADHFKLMYCPADTVIKDRTYYTNRRVIIPIHDVTGKAVSWQGRDITGRALRYLFPPGFEGANFLFNAWSIPNRADYLILSEGVFDAFGWWLDGFKNVVATFGKKISESQMDMIRYLKPKAIFIAWDSDAMWENYEFFEKYSYLFKIRIIDLGGKDADEMTRDEKIKALSNAGGYSWESKILSAL
jgi:DNA primase